MLPLAASLMMTILSLPTAVDAGAGFPPATRSIHAMGDKMKPPRRTRRLRQATLLLGFCLTVYCFLFISRTPVATRQKLTPELLASLSLDTEQCSTAFPGLTKEIDDAVAEGPFTLKQMGDSGPVQGRIKNGQLYIIHAQRRADLSTEMLNSRTSSLHQLHRALLTSPSPLPDTIFSLNFQDSPFGTSWTYSRPSSTSLRAPGTRNFLMPHFSFWSWPLPFIGSLPRAAASISRLESILSWKTKIPKAVWRGTIWFNSVANPRMRQNLVQSVKKAGWDWHDVEALQWDTGKGDGRNASNALPIEEFCRYRYVIHTEGVAYSGRFQFLQMCRSVVLTPPIEWMQHVTHLVRPVFSSSLLDGRRARKAGGELKRDGKNRWIPSKRTREAWPVEYKPEEANIVFVAPDWSDLEDTVGWLEDHPNVAEGIASRQRDMFAGGGYFSPAAEVCYWRALVRGWASVVRTEGEGWEDQVGVPFEEFALSNGS